MIKSPIPNKEIEFANVGIRPFVFDIVAPDGITSLLPDDIKMTLHVNPKNIEFSYTKQHEISSTLSGWVEYYWGDGPQTLSLETASGAFIRPHTGLSAITGPVSVDRTYKGFNDVTIGTSIGGTRRDTITYDKYLDLLALFHNNGAVYDQTGRTILQGKIKMIFDGGVWFGWFQSFNVTDDANSPYSFNVSLSLQIEREYHGVRTQMPRKGF
jgi:hypothetical protein